MTEPIEPIKGVSAVTPIEEIRAEERRARDRRVKQRRAEQAGAAGDSTRLPVPVKQPRAAKPAQEAAAGAAAFAAQLLGQRGQKRGLKGGPKVLESARSAYLETEYSGLADRRLPAGKIKKTEA